MSNILITGAGGFLGRHVVDFWAKYNENYDRLFIPSSKELEVREYIKVLRFLKTFNIKGIIHLAALCGGIGANQKRPGDFIYQNLQMGTSVLEAARVCGIEKVVLLGTVCMYPKFTSAPFQEQDLWNGYPEETNAPYGIAKKAVMEMGMAYAKQYGMNIINLIPTNLIGAFDHFETDRSHVVPALIRKIDEAIKSNAPSITVWGDGSASREFLDAKDAARAIYLAYQRYNSPLPVNIGSGNEVSIKKLVELLCKLMNYKGEIEWDQSKPNGQPRRCLDISKARDFGFNARITLDISLETAIDYYRETVHA